MALNNLASYIAELSEYSTKYQTLFFSTTDEEKSLFLDSRDGRVNVNFAIDLKSKPHEG